MKRLVTVVVAAGLLTLPWAPALVTLPPAHAAEPAKAEPRKVVQLPDVVADPGELSIIDVSSVDADAAEWVAGGLKVLPQYRPGETKAWGLAFATSKTGTYQVFGAAAKGGQPFAVLVKVTVGTTPPTPPGPGPQPQPTDPLTALLQSAYTSEMDPAKVTKLAALADYYGAVIAAAKTDAGVTSLATLQAKIHAGADVVAGAGGLPALRKVAAGYVAGKLPATDQPMTADLWATAAGAYSDLSASLRKVK